RHGWTSETRARLSAIVNPAPGGGTGSIYGGAEWPGEAGGLPGEPGRCADGEKRVVTSSSARIMTIAVIAPTASRGLDRAAAVPAAAEGTCRGGGPGGGGGGGGVCGGGERGHGRACVWPAGRVLGPQRLDQVAERARVLGGILAPG